MANEERIDFALKKDFDFIAQDYKKSVLKLLDALRQIKTSEEALETSKKAFYSQRFIDDMAFFGHLKFVARLKEFLSEEFGTADILRKIYSESFDLIIENLSGKQIIGENQYYIISGLIYYRTFVGKWYIIDQNEAFLLLPKLNKIVQDDQLISQLDSMYASTELEKMFINWKTEDSIGKVDDALLFFDGAISPTEHLEKTTKQISSILQKPISFKEIVDANKQDENFIENIFKVGFKLIQFIDPLRAENIQPIYMLRDGILFSEIHKTFDLLDGISSNVDQLLINRKLLSKNSDDEYYWALTADSLYVALRKSEGDFSKYYTYYSDEIKNLENTMPDFKQVMTMLGDYIRDNIDFDNKRTPVVIDTGLQGSINMLTKYLIDNYAQSQNKPESDVRMFVVGDWFKDVYSGKYESEYYPIMKDIEIFNRSENLYKYKLGSLQDGQIKMVMGTKEDQFLANLELIVLVTLCRLFKKSNRN